MINGTVILAGQLLGTAFACGLNLYATVALIGLAGRLDLIPDLPPGMSGLENGVVIGIAGALYIIEFITDRIPIAGSAWEAVHTLIRPAAAGLLAALAFQGLPLYIQFGAAAAAAAMALAAHGSKAGIRLILATRRHAHAGRSWAHVGLSILEDLAAVGLAVAALMFPGIAIFVVAASLALMLLAGPRLWRAAFLGLRALTARTRGFFGSPGWYSRDQLPGAIRALIPHEPLGRRAARAAPAAVHGLPRVGAYRCGWIVFTCDGPRFIYRSLLGARTADLTRITHVDVRTGLLTDALEVRCNGTTPARAFTFFLLKDGPPPHIAAAELTSADS